LKLSSRYYLDIDPHEDALRITALLVIVLTLGVLVALDKLPAESFIAIVTLIVGYLVGRIRGRPELAGSERHGHLRREADRAGQHASRQA